MSPPLSLADRHPLTALTLLTGTEGTVPETFFGPAKLPVFHPRFNLQIMRLDNKCVCVLCCWRQLLFGSDHCLCARRDHVEC